MARDPALKVRPGEGKLLPFFIGTTQGKNKRGKVVNHVHYVLIQSAVATKLGISKKAIIRNGSDSTVDAVVFRNSTRKVGTQTKTGQAKRYLQRGSKPIELYLANQVKTPSGDKAWESYVVGFPSGVPLTVILKFVRDNCSKVIRINTGSNFYGVR
jgi:translation initiation factor IF-2